MRVKLVLRYFGNYNYFGNVYKGNNRNSNDNGSSADIDNNDDNQDNNMMKILNVKSKMIILFDYNIS